MAPVMVAATSNVRCAVMVIASVLIGFENARDFHFRTKLRKEHTAARAAIAMVFRRTNR